MEGPNLVEPSRVILGIIVNLDTFLFKHENSNIYAFDIWSQLVLCEWGNLKFLDNIVRHLILLSSSVGIDVLEISNRTSAVRFKGIEDPKYDQLQLESLDRKTYLGRPS